MADSMELTMPLAAFNRDVPTATAATMATLVPRLPVKHPAVNFSETAATASYTLSLNDALPISTPFFSCW